MSKEARNQAFLFYHQKIVPFMKNKGMTLNEFSDACGIPAKRLRRFGDGAEEMKRNELKDLMEYMFPQPKQVSVPKPTMTAFASQTTNAVDRSAYSRIRVLRYLTYQYIDGEHINDIVFSELVSEASGTKISHASIWNFKSGASENPSDRIVNAIRGWLESENALEKYGMPPDGWSPATKSKKNKSRHILPMKKHDDIDEIGKDLLGLGKPSAMDNELNMTEAERLLSEEREAEVKRRMDEMYKNGLPVGAERITPPIDSQKSHNEWANARLIATIVRGDLLSDKEKQVALHALFPAFFTTI